MSRRPHRDGHAARTGTPCSTYTMPINRPPTRSCCSAPPATSPSASCSLRSTTSSGTASSSVPVIGVARSDWTDDAFREQRPRRRSSSRRADADAAVIDRADGAARPDPGRLLRPGDVGGRSRDTLDEHGSKHAVFYMAIPPTMFPTVAESLASVGLNERGRIVVEKPFGRDLQSARELNATLHTVFPEERIFRIDHYLGKESVEDLLVFRFSNTLLEPIWNRNYVRSVQVTMSETIGVEGRGASTTVSARSATCCRTTCCRSSRCWRWSRRSVPSRSFLQDEKAKVLRGDASRSTRSRWCAGSTSATATSRASRPTRRSRRSSPRGSRSTRGAGPACRGTSASARRSPQSATEVVVEFQSSRRSLLFDEAGGPTPGRNLVRLRLGKHDGVTFTLQAKTPGPHLDSQNGRHRRRLRRRARRAARGLRAPARRRHRRLAPPLRPRGRRRADVAGRAAGARRPRPGAPLLPRDVGSGGGRPDPRRPATPWLHDPVRLPRCDGL